MTISSVLPLLFSSLLCLGGFIQEAEQSESLVEQPAVVILMENVRIPAREAGVIEAFEYAEGELVEYGVTLVRLDDDVQKMQVAIAEGEVYAAKLAANNNVDIEYADKSSAVAQKTLERSIRANQRSRKAVSHTEIERLELEYERGQLAGDRARMEQQVAISQLDIRRTKLTEAQMRLDQRSIRSPMTGMVVERLAQAGEWVNAGQPVIRIVRLDRLRIQCLLDATKFDTSLVGQPVEFQVGQSPGEESIIYQGTVTFVSPEVIPNRNQIKVWAEIDNSDMLLRPGTAGTIKINASDDSEPIDE